MRFFISLTDDDGQLITRFEIAFSEDIPMHLVEGYEGEFCDAICAPELSRRLRHEMHVHKRDNPQTGND